MAAYDHNITLRRMEKGDAEAGLHLSFIAGWNQLKADWEFFYSLNPSGGFVAEHNGRVVGTVTTTDYGGKVGWVAMVLVAPEFRHRGIATRLLKRAVEGLSHLETIKLDATPAGRQVYQRMGFKDEYNLTRFTGSSAAVPECKEKSTGRVRAMTGKDIEPVIALDAEALGVPRPEVIRGLMRMAPEYAMVWDCGRKIEGFVMGRHGAMFEFVGPLIASDFKGAEALMRSFCLKVGDKKVAMDTPEQAGEWGEFLKMMGMAPQRSFMRMYRGEHPFSGRTELVCGGAGPELG